MSIIRNMSIKTSVSLLLVFTTIAFLGIVLFGFHQMTTEVDQRLEENHASFQALNQEMEQVIQNNLAQVSKQINSNFSIFLNKMKELTVTIEYDPLVQVFADPASASAASSASSSSSASSAIAAAGNQPDGSPDPYEILPAVNRLEWNELFTPYFANLANGIAEIQYAYIGTPNKEMYIGPLGDYDFRTFDPTTRPWYQDAKAKPHDYIWTQPYIDAITGKPVMTLAKAIVGNEPDKPLLGVIGLDFSLDTLAAIVNSVEFGHSGYAFLLDSEGNLITHPKWNDLLGKKLTGYDFLDTVYNGDHGIIQFAENERDMLGYFYTNELTGWKLIVTAPEEELLSMNNVIQQVEQQNFGIIEGLKESERRIMLMFIVNGALIMILGIVITHIYSRSMNRRIQNVSDAMGKVSGGDLTQKIPVDGNNEISMISRRFNRMVDDLKQLVMSNLRMAEQLSHASDTLRNVSRRSSEGAENIQQILEEVSTFLDHQAQSSRQAGTMLESFTLAMDQAMEAIRQVDQTVQKSHEVSSKGSSSITELEEASNQNLELTRTVTQNIEELSRRMNQVYEFTTVIQEIASRTNLLALNAAIEATRAGDDGLGFAVVAQEIRKLAEQSSASAKDISEDIRHIQTHFEKTVDNIQLTEQMAYRQHEVLGLSKEGFDQIRQAIDEIRERMAETGRYIEDIQDKSTMLIQSVEQNIAESDRAAQYVSDIQHTLEEQIQAIKEVSASSDELTSVTETLLEETRKFKTD